jgi:hypothetical protein
VDDPHRSLEDFDNPYRSPAAPLEGPAQPKPRPPADTTFGDARAQRAWRAAVVGLLVFPPLLNLYSAWILLELAFRDHPLSPGGSRRYILAWLVNILACIGVGMFLVPGISLIWR